MSRKLMYKISDKEVKGQMRTHFPYEIFISN